MKTPPALTILLTAISLVAICRVDAGDRVAAWVPDYWQPWAARPELAPVTHFSQGQWQIEVGVGQSSQGGWDLEWRTIRPGQWYRASVSCQTAGISSIHDTVAAELIWWKADGERADWRYVRFRQAPDDTLEFTCADQAPSDAVRVTLRLSLRWTDSGKVVWRTARLEPAAAPTPRLVKMAIATGRFPGTSVTANLDFACRLINQAADAGAKVVCLPETITTWKTRDLVNEGACPIPGPQTDALCALAKRRDIDIVCSIYEQDGQLIHNTGLYIDAHKGIIGKYRKVHLAVRERWRGITPGREFPVWDTAWGRAGMLICYDNVHPEGHRILAQKGAEVIFLPIMGDPRAVGEKGFETWKRIMSVRALDNHVWMVVCQNKGQWGVIVRPDGEIVGQVDPATGMALVEIDLNFRNRSWIGSDFENRNWGDRRPDVYRELTADR